MPVVTDAIQKEDFKQAMVVEKKKRRTARNPVEPYSKKFIKDSVEEYLKNGGKITRLKFYEPNIYENLLQV